MTTFKQMREAQEINLTHINKYRVASNIKEYQVIPKSIFPRIRQLFHVRNVSKNFKINMCKMDVRTF